MISLFLFIYLLIAKIFYTLSIDKVETFLFFLFPKEQQSDRAIEQSVNWLICQINQPYKDYTKMTTNEWEAEATLRPTLTAVDEEKVPLELGFPSWKF